MTWRVSVDIVGTVDIKEMIVLPNYAEMYETLFRSMTKAITLLQEAQKLREQMYIEGKEPALIVLPKAETEPLPKP